MSLFPSALVRVSLFVQKALGFKPQLTNPNHQLRLPETNGSGSKNRYQNGTLVRGNMDQHLRNPSCLILSHSQIECQNTALLPTTHLTAKEIIKPQRRNKRLCPPSKNQVLHHPLAQRISENPANTTLPARVCLDLGELAVILPGAVVDDHEPSTRPQDPRQLPQQHCLVLTSACSGDKNLGIECSDLSRRRGIARSEGSSNEFEFVGRKTGSPTELRKPSRSSSREVRKRVPTFFCSLF